MSTVPPPSYRSLKTTVVFANGDLSIIEIKRRKGDTTIVSYQLLKAYGIDCRIVYESSKEK